MKTKKRCSRCKKEKDRSEFYSNKAHKDKLHHYCKKCHKEINKRDYENNPEKLKARIKKWQKNNPAKARESKIKSEQKNRRKHTDEYYQNLSGTKRCSKCKEIKDVKEFTKDRANKDGLDDHCKECCKEHNRKWRIKYNENNPEYFKEHQRKWVRNNPNYHKEYIRKWRTNHSKKIKETKKIYQKV